MNELLGEPTASRCGRCGERLRWTKNHGTQLQVWFGVCECGWLRAMQICAVAEEHQT